MITQAKTETTPLATGMALRQYMGQKFSQFDNPPNGDLAWRFSPDLLVYGQNAAYSTSYFNTTIDDYNERSWYFSQVPTPGKTNYIYVRSKCLTPSQVSTLYFYYATDATLLQPQKWKTDTFTMQDLASSGPPLPGNSMKMQALATNSLVVSCDPVKQKGTLMTWTPATSDHYYLICWVDNTGSDGPPFASLSDFTDTNALGEYIANHPQMTLLDTLYQSIFMRQNPGQTNAQEPSGTQTSPDILVTSNAAVLDYTQFATDASYQSSSLNNTVTLQERNFIYIRAKNTASQAKSARVYLFWTTTDQMAPASWRTDKFTVAGQACNYVDLQANQGGDILVSQLPVVWIADSLPTSTSQYILATYVDDSGDYTYPPDLSTFGFPNPQAVTQFVTTQPRMAWLSLTAVQPNPAPSMTTEIPMIFPAGAQGQSTYVGLQFVGVDTKSTVSFSIPGSSAGNTIIKANMAVPDPNAIVIWKVTFGEKAFNTSLVLNLWSNGGSSQPGAKVLPCIISSQTP